jgi:antitoxin (DNA-binding transcriptional repressor) of toxin-antitoxin stability system
LSRLIDRAAKGEPFVIAKAGKPMVKVVALEAPEAGRVRRLGFMAGQIAVPDDFDRMGKAEIERLFGIGP